MSTVTTTRTKEYSSSSDDQKDEDSDVYSDRWGRGEQRAVVGFVPNGGVVE